MTTLSKYWANWTTHLHAGSALVIRKDTRLFWREQATGTVGTCIGCFIGENPGGASSIHGPAFTGYSPIADKRGDGDNTLRLLHEIWTAAVMNHGQPKPDCTDYIEILNTYYIKNAKSGAARELWRAAGGRKIYFQTPSRSARFVLLGWGVAHTTEPEALAMVAPLALFERVIIPFSNAKVAVRAGAALPCPIVPGPTTPSYILRNSKVLKPSYIANVAREFR